MFAIQKTLVFDSELFKNGSFITIDILKPEKASGKLVAIQRVNAIINYCDTDELVMTDKMGEEWTIRISDVEGYDSSNKKPLYRIVGVAPHVDQLIK